MNTKRTGLNGWRVGHWVAAIGTGPAPVVSTANNVADVRNLLFMNAPRPSPLRLMRTRTLIATAAVNHG